jgi:hypothetical protein
MKRIIVSIVISLILLFGLLMGANAQMAKEGEGPIKSYWSFTVRSLTMEKERGEYQSEINGIIDAPENSPLYNATAYGFESDHAIKGVYQGRGFMRYTRPDGDLIFGTFETSGNAPKGERKGLLTFVGGTGKCTGITGTIEILAGPQLRPGHQTYMQSISVGKIKWKIP